MKKKRETFTYTYRSTCGMDITVTAEIDPGLGKQKMVDRVVQSFRNSETPLVELDGKKIDIIEFLKARRLEIECDIKSLRSQCDRLTREILRREAK